MIFIWSYLLHFDTIWILLLDIIRYFPICSQKEEELQISEITHRSRNYKQRITNIHTQQNRPLQYMFQEFACYINSGFVTVFIKWSFVVCDNINFKGLLFSRPRVCRVEASCWKRVFLINALVLFSRTYYQYITIAYLCVSFNI